MSNDDYLKNDDIRGSDPGSIRVVSIEVPQTGIDVASQVRAEFDFGLQRQPDAVQLRVDRPDVLSVSLARLQIKTQSFIFPRPTSAVGGPDGVPPGHPLGRGGAPLDSEPQARKSPQGGTPTRPASSVTRLKPPGDIVKLKDRLLYVLQPSLETLLADSSLDFPFVPFPYQFEGVAFLFPRVAAVLADEMGLGKTMQAITAIRLLMHSGEVAERAAWFAPSRW